MSKATEVNKGTNVLHTDFDTKKLFRFNNRFAKIDFENTTGAEQVLKGGTLIGRVGGTNNGEILKSAAVDGSENPVGVLANPEITLAIAETREVDVCVAGDVEETLIILDGGDTLDTIINNRSLRDKIGADTVGIKLVVADELTGHDNQ